MFDYSALVGKIKEIFGTQEKFANAIGISRASLYQKLKNNVEFTQIEMKQAMKVLKLSDIDIPKYFFTTKVKKTKQAC